MSRPRHPDKDLEGLLQELEKQDWRVTRERKYYRIRCPCPKKHQGMIHLTPHRGYALRRRRWLISRTCFREVG